MTNEELDHAIGAIELAITNGGAIKMIAAEGIGRSNRDINLGLNADDSQQVFAAVGDVLRNLRG